MEKREMAKRRGNYIEIEPGVTAIEGMDGNLPTLIIRRGGKIIKTYRGSSLVFARRLTDEDSRYLASLGQFAQTVT
jgi:hypothetical protein